jgi:HNH endonuclease
MRAPGLHEVNVTVARKRGGTTFLAKQMDLVKREGYAYRGRGSDVENRAFLEILKTISAHLQDVRIPVRFRLPDGPAAPDKGRVKMAERGGMIVLETDGDGYVTRVRLLPRQEEVEVDGRVDRGISTATPNPGAGGASDPSTQSDQAAREIARLQRMVADRSGQSDFRYRVLAVYGSRCAVTGAETACALEAAHIEPWIEGRDDDTSNRLLLRADSHALFDAELISIGSDTMRVRIAPQLAGDPVYADLQKRPLPPAGPSLPGPSATKLRTLYGRFLRRHGMSPGTW